MSKKKQIIEIKECIDAVYGADCAYFDVDGFASAEEIYNAGYRKQGWISIDERLPEDFETVLALCKDGGMFVGRCARYTVSYKWEIWTAMKSTRTVSRKVTHWMPLPEAPKGGAE